MIIDNFLAGFDKFSEYARTVEYGPVKNNVDQVVYPFISTEIPEQVFAAIFTRLRILFPFKKVLPNTLFMRLSPKGAKAPHYAHTDSSMGTHSLMLYINRGEGGTSFLKHKETGMTIDPKTQEELDAWKRDMNDPKKWQRIDFCPIKPNRACIFEANKFHAAEPIGGFGKTPKDARLVLTLFFSLEDR